MIYLIISILPIYLIGLYFYKKDTIKEPTMLLTKLFISGIIASLIVIYISIKSFTYFPTLLTTNNNNIIFLLIYCFIFIALTEELTKFLMIYIISYHNPEFNQAYDIILYSVFVGLGFAFFENIIYTIENPSLINIFLRGITAIPAHACFQTIMGYYLYKNKIQRNAISMLESLFIPIFLHGLYDFLIISNNNFFILIFIALLISIFIITYFKIQELVAIDQSNLPNNDVN